MREIEWMLGINVAGHGGSICLLHRGELVIFLKEERISRTKRDHSCPFICVKEILQYTNHLDYVVFANTNDEDQQHFKSLFRKHRIRVDSYFDDDVLSSDKQLYVRNKYSTHHLNHASSGYYLSPFEESICVVMDGWGHIGDLISLFNNDFYGGIDLILGHRLYEHVTILKKERSNTWKDQWKVLYKEVATDCNRGSEYEGEYTSWSNMEGDLKELYSSQIELDEENLRLVPTISSGVMYEAVTGFLGFNVEDVGKVMGLSPYGKEDKNLPPFFCNEKFDSNANLFHPSLLLNNVIYPDLDDYRDSFEKRSNLAYAVQNALEKKVLYIIDKAMKLDPCKNIVLSGGIFHNIVINGILVEKYPDYNFFADPLCDDAGHSYGSAKMVYDEVTGNHVKDNVDNLFLGPHYDVSKLEKRIRKHIQKVSK